MFARIVGLAAAKLLKGLAAKFLTQAAMHAASRVAGRRIASPGDVFSSKTPGLVFVILGRLIGRLGRIVRR